MIEGKTVVCVAIGGDPLHQGHVAHIKEASKLGDYLIVIVGSDAQIVMKYGYVLSPLHERIRRVAKKAPFIQGIAVSVDKDNLAMETLRWLKPDIYAKGGDRTPENMPQAELDICKDIGCQVVYGVDGVIKSSTSIRKRIERFRLSMKS